MVLVSLHLTPLRQPRTLEPGDDDFTMLGSPRLWWFTQAMFDDQPGDTFQLVGRLYRLVGLLSSSGLK